jgi:phosphatidate cytidylyltransferase
MPIARLISGTLVGVFFLLAAFFLPQIWVWVVLAAVSLLGQLEFYAIMTHAQIPVFRVLGAICGTALISATVFTAGPNAEDILLSYQWENVVLLGSFILIFIRQFPQRNNPVPLATIGCTILGILYVPFLINYASRLAFGWTETAWDTRMSGTGQLLILYMLIVIKITDIGAYTFGRLFGRHKLCPRLSPGKTWEGFIGGLSMSTLASMIFCWTNDGSIGALSFSMTHAVILGLLMGVTAVAGDLFESLIKRATNIKDSSGIVPGMGGVLDVIDSILFGAPVLYGYVTLVLR